VILNLGVLGLCCLGEAFDIAAAISLAADLGDSFCRKAAEAEPLIARTKGVFFKDLGVADLGVPVLDDGVEYLDPGVAGLEPGVADFWGVSTFLFLLGVGVGMVMAIEGTEDSVSDTLGLLVGEIRGEVL
jgi:hypothetical protein